MNKPTVLITGALTGIGHATAVAFAQSGINVVVSSRSEEKSERLVRELKNFKIEAEYIFADVRHEEDVRNLVDWANIRFGGFDVAVNNAEIEGKSGSIVEQSVEDFNAVFETNVLGTFLSMKHELRVMLKQKSGVIINISSIFERRGGTGDGIRAASGRAIEALTKAAALEAVNENVRVNAVAPGSTAIEMPVLPAEVAQTIIFLASDKARFINGQIIGVGGGKAAL